MSARSLSRLHGPAAALLLLACAQASRAEERAPSASPDPHADATGISLARYVTGGLVGTFVGFGLGHAIADEWTNFGWICTAGELTPLLVGAASGSFRKLGNQDHSDDLVPIALIVSASIFHVIEVVDIWTGPRVRADSAAASAPGWAVLPLPQRHGAAMRWVGSF